MSDNGTTETDRLNGRPIQQCSKCKLWATAFACSLNGCPMAQTTAGEAAGWECLGDGACFCPDCNSRDTGPPIDICEIAARRYAAARTGVLCAEIMQASPIAEVQYTYALIELRAAASDLSAAQRLATELMEHENATIES